MKLPDDFGPVIHFQPHLPPRVVVRKTEGEEHGHGKSWGINTIEKYLLTDFVSFCVGPAVPLGC